MAIGQDNRKYVERLFWLRLVLGIGFAVLFSRLWYVSVLRYEKYSELAEKNRVRQVPLVPPRGLIEDRNGRVLAENSLGFDLVLYQDEVRNWPSTRQFLAESGFISAAGLERRLAEVSHYGRYQPVYLKENLSMAEVSFLLARKSDHPELDLIRRPRRIYHFGELASHALGYVGEVSREELGYPEFSSAEPGDVIGKSGLERSYNGILAGVGGYQRVLVNSRGKQIEQLDRVMARPGDVLQLTLDLDLQRAAEDALGERSGSVVAVDPRNGEILALVSKPGFDPNLFASGISRQAWEGLVQNPEYPLRNRVVQNAISPGSIFKIVMAIAGLESGAIDETTHVFCPGGIELYGHYFRCWNPKGHGSLDVVGAIQNSCNVFFYLLGQKMGIERIAEFSRDLGLGQTTGIDVSGERPGLVPSREWKLAATGRPWYLGETISVAIGQGPLNVTPLQLARMVGIVATGLAPRLHLKMGEAQPPDALRSRFSQASIEKVREGMWRVVNAGGTGGAAAVPGFDVCGKTGTVQVIGKESLERLSTEEAARFDPHAWFTGFAPRDNPEIVVVVLVEHGKSGGLGAAPVAGQVFRTYYEIQRRGSGGPEVAGFEAGDHAIAAQSESQPTGEEG